MEKESEIKKMWKKFKKNEDSIEIPEIFFGLYMNKVYFTKSDNRSICYFMGDDFKIYVAAKRNCEIENIDGTDIYVIEGDYRFQVISCPSEKDIIDGFMVNMLKKLNISKK